MALVNEGNLAGGRDRVRDVSEARAGRAERRDRKGARRAAEEVVLDSAALRARLDGVRDRIARAAGRAGRDPASIRLVAVSKTFSADHVRAAADAGQLDFGENKVQEGAARRCRRPRDLPLRWHLIGHLQSNKARKAGAHFRRHSLGRRRATCWQARRSGRAAGRASVDVLDPGRSRGRGDQARGHAGRRCCAIFDGRATCRAARSTGLMLLPPAVDDPEAARPYFAALRRAARRPRGAGRRSGRC